MTAPIIAENAVKTANATRQALLPSADTFTEVAPETPTEGVTAIYKADVYKRQVHQRLQVPQDIFPVFRHKSIDLFQKKFFVHKQSPCIVDTFYYSILKGQHKT